MKIKVNGVLMSKAYVKCDTVGLFQPWYLFDMCHLNLGTFADDILLNIYLYFEF